MDLLIAPGTTLNVAATQGDPCTNQVLYPVLAFPGGSGDIVSGPATGWMRLYLVDVPDGLSMRVLVIAVVAPEATFERAVAEALPVVDSIEFHAQ